MIEISRLKDSSEIIHYNNPGIPLYIKKRRLSSYANMEALCHWHEDMEYIRTLEGRMAYYVNGEKIIIREQDALIINSRQMHYGFSENKEDCSFLCILFRLQLLNSNPEITEKYIRPIMEHPELPWLYLHGDCPEERQIISHFDRIYDLQQQMEPCFELKILSGLTAVWADLYQLLSSDFLPFHTVNDENLTIQRNMITFIYEHYGSRLSLEDIAASGHVCRSKCCRIFKQYLNRSPVEFLNAYRLEVSMRYLTDTSMTITEIALACGFQSPSYYSEIFQQYKGCTPSRYRLRQTQEDR